MEGVWQAFQDSGFAAFVRQSVYVYPLANVMHVLAVMSFFALVAAMDFRLLGMFRSTPAHRVIAGLRPAAIIVLIVIVATGLTLLAPEAVAVAGNPAFLFKAIAIALAFLNLVVNMWAMGAGDDTVLVRLSASFSLLLWLLAAAMGRLIAYL